MIRRILSIVLSFCFFAQQTGLAAAAVGEFNLSGAFSSLSGSAVRETFRPVHLRYFSYDQSSTNFKALFDKGDQKELSSIDSRQLTQELMDFFLIGVSLPNDQFWVNLRPDTQEQIIDQEVERTDLGRILLEADLQLKKDTARYTSPQTSTGKQYWDRLYKKAGELYGTQSVSIPTLTRPWIVPNEIIVRQTDTSAYVYKATLKVMLEQDYLKVSKDKVPGAADYTFKDDRAKALNEYSSALIRELIIPQLTKEVNTSKKYAELRQVYYSLIMSRWFKQKFTGTEGGYAGRIDRHDLTGLTSKQAWSKDTYFKEYQRSFAQGEYNIKEPVTTPSGQMIRSYFSGGIQLAGRQIVVQNGVNLRGAGGRDISGALSGGLGMLERLGTAGSPIVDLEARKDWQGGVAAADSYTKYHIAINGGRGRMGLLYLHSLLYDEEYSEMGIVAVNGIPWNDLEDFLQKVKDPDSTYGRLFPGITINVLERNNEQAYILMELNGQKVVFLNDRQGAIRWNLVERLVGADAVQGFGIVESSGQNLEYQKSMDVHIASVPEGVVVFGAPPKDVGTKIGVFGVNEEDAIYSKSQVVSNASCTTNAIAPPAAVLHKRFGVKRATLLTIHAETSDQSPTETFRGDEPARARPGHKVQSASKTGAAKLLPKLIPGIGPNDGKAIRVGTLTGSAVVYTAELERPATVQEIRELYIQAEKDNPRVFGTGHNLASKHIIRDTRSTIVDLDAIEVSPDGLTAKIVTWYDNEYGYHKRALDLLKATLIAKDQGKRIVDFEIPTPAAKAKKEVTTIDAAQLEGLAAEGALPMSLPAAKFAEGPAVDLYLTGIKEKQPARNGQIILRMLMGDPRFNVKGIVVEGIKNDNFSATMKAFAQSIIYSSDLGNIEGLRITPLLTNTNEMFLLFETGARKRLVPVFSSMPQSIAEGAKVMDVTKMGFSYADMINEINGSLQPLGARLLSTVISMSTRPGGKGELLDSGKAISIPQNIIPTKIAELDKAGIMYQAYQVPVNSGSYLVANFSVNGMVEKKAVDALIESIPGIGVEENTSSNFVANRTNMLYDKSQTVVIPDAKNNATMVTLFFLVNEELNAANKVLDEAYPYAKASSSMGEFKEKVTRVRSLLNTEIANPEPGEAQERIALGAARFPKYTDAWRMLDEAARAAGVSADIINELKSSGYLKLSSEQVAADRSSSGEEFPVFLHRLQLFDYAISVSSPLKTSEQSVRTWSDFAGLEVDETPVSITVGPQDGQTEAVPVIGLGHGRTNQFRPSMYRLTQNIDVDYRIVEIETFNNGRLIFNLISSGDGQEVVLFRDNKAVGNARISVTDAVNTMEIKVFDGDKRIEMTVSKAWFDFWQSARSQAGVTGAAFEVAGGYTMEIKPASSSSATKDTASPEEAGGIDFRNKAMDITYETLGSFSSLDVSMPVLSKEELAAFDLDQEALQIESMLDHGVMPSEHRIKEFMAASSALGQLPARRDTIIIWLAKIGMMEESQCCAQEASDGYKEAIVLADAG